MIFHLLTDNGSTTRLRRSTMIMSLMILFVAALRFDTNQIDFFGFKINFEQDRFILIARICLAFIFTTYLLRIMIFFWSTYIQHCRTGLEIYRNKGENLIRSDYPEYYFGNNRDNDDNQGAPGYAEINDLQVIMTTKSSTLDQWEKIAGYINLCVDFIFHFAPPLVLAVVAIFQPISLSQILDFIQSK